VGLRRGRRSPSDLYVGEALDFWRVEALEEEKLLRLRAEMRVPGRAWLEFHVEQDGALVPPRPQPAPAEGDVQAARAVRQPLLVGAGAVPRLRLRRDGPQHLPRGGGADGGRGG
jgi:hypothetical protein